MTHDEYTALLEAEADIDTYLSPDPIQDRFQVVNFLSLSKGRHRRRKEVKEITLVRDRWEPGNMWRLPERVKWDCLATETGVSESDLIAELVGRYDVSIK